MSAVRELIPFFLTYFCERYLLQDAYIMLPMHADTCNYSNNAYTMFLTCVNILFMFLTYIYTSKPPYIYIYIDIHIKKERKKEIHIPAYIHT